MSTITNQKVLSRPTVITTQAYRDNPIQFTPNTAFEPESVLRELTTVPVISRDDNAAAMVDLNNPVAQLYPVEMSTITYKRSDQERIIDTQFRQLI